MISTEKQKTEVRMRRIITLILLAADIYLGVQIYRSFMNDQFNLAALSFKNEHTAGNEADYPVGSDSYNPGNAEGPHYFSGSSIPTGQVTLGGSHKTDESASSSQTYRDEDYGTSDGFVIQRFQEFDWYRNAGSAGIPAGAQRLTDPSEIYGIYHVYVRFDPDNQNGTIADLLGDARIDAGQYGTLVHMDWNYTYYHKKEKWMIPHPISPVLLTMEPSRHRVRELSRSTRSSMMKERSVPSGPWRPPTGSRQISPL